MKREPRTCKPSGSNRHDPHREATVLRTVHPKILLPTADDPGLEGAVHRARSKGDRLQSNSWNVRREPEIRWSLPGRQIEHPIPEVVGAAPPNARVGIRCCLQPS